MFVGIQEAFEKQRGDDGFLHEQKLNQALMDCGKKLSSKDIQSEIRRTNSCPGVSLDEFTALVLRRTKVEYWAATMSLERILAFCLPVKVHESDNVLDSIVALSSSELKDVIKQFSKNVNSALLSSIDTLKSIKMQRADEQSSARRQSLLKGGKVSEFHVSLTDSLGWPSLDFFHEMEREHIVAPAEGNICPWDEFDYARGTKKVPQHEMKQGREVKDYSQLMKGRTAKQAKLIKEEVIAIILYTGPMFGPYNSELRSIFRNGKASKHKRPRYLTTIFVISSAIVKLTRTQHIPCGLILYRGLGGDVDYPGYFYNSDELGCQGIAEPGFMSTTKRRETAIRYSGLKKGKNCPRILEMHVRSVDRGADISEFSQYQHEAEFHWPPGCFLELLGQRDELIEYRCEDDAHRQGVLSIFEVRVNCNLKTMTIDELLLVRKNIHLQTFQLLISDTRRILEDDKALAKVEKRLAQDRTLLFNSKGGHVGKPICTAGGLVNKLMLQCEEVRDVHMKVVASDYISVIRYRELVRMMLESVAMAKSKLKGWMEDASRKICLDFGCALRICHRERMSFLLRTLPSAGKKQQKQAEQLCIELGLIVEKAIETNDLHEPRLVEAAAAGRPERDIQLLLAAKADVNMPDREGCTPMFAAARNGHVSVLKLLIDNRGSLNSRNHQGETPVWIASKNSQTRCLDLLIKRKASVLVADKGSASPTWVAAQYGRDEVLETLLKSKADINAADDRGCTPIVAAAHMGKADCVKLLLRNGADANIATNGKHTPLMMAAQEGHPDCVRLLLSVEGVSVNQQEQKDGETAVYTAAEMGHETCVGLLLKGQADPNVANRRGQTPVWIAAKRGAAECIRLLAAARADISAPSKRGVTPVQAATGECAELLRRLAEEDSDAARAQDHLRKRQRRG